MRRSLCYAMAAVFVLCTGAGAQQPPPLVTSPDWLPWYQLLLNSRLAASPLERPTTYYFSQAGNDATGDGSLQNPWRTLAKGQAVLDAAPAGGVALLFRRGDVWREQVGLVAIAPSVTIADYGQGEKPLFTTFVPIGNPAGWSPVPGMLNTYSRAWETYISWIKEDGDLDRPYSRQNQAEQVEANEGSWCWDGSDLFIHPKHNGGLRATDPRTDGKAYEIAAQTLSGVIISGDGSRVQNIRTQGWGLTQQLGTQCHGIESRAQGAARVAFVGCESHYSLAHVMTHYSSQGGIATFVDCRAGLTTFAAFGGETMFNTYAEHGGNQTIFDHCTATHGTLPSFQHPGGNRQGVAFYGHSDGGQGDYLGLTISYACTTRDTRYGCKTSGNFNDLQPAGTLDQVRCFYVNEVFEGGDTTGDLFQVGVGNAARVNGRYLNLRPPPIGGAAMAPWQAGGWLINCTVQVDCSAQPLNFALFNAGPGSTNRVNIWNCFISSFNPPGILFSLDWDFPSQSESATLYNTIISSTGGGGCVPNIGGLAGVSSNAYYGVAPPGYAMDPRAVVLQQAPDPALVPACNSVLSCAAAPLPPGFALCIDQRGPVVERNDIGPLESPPCGNCDGSTAPPVLNVSDFICFLNKFATGDPAANCDGSTEPPVLNVSDFICFLNAFGAGCR